MATVDELQATIDALNARTAAYDVQIAGLNQQLADAQHAIDMANEDKAKAVADANEAADARIEQVIKDANTAIEAAGQQTLLYQRRWEAQNKYVVALEADATGDVAKTIADHAAAVRAVQIQMLQAMNAQPSA